MERLKRGTVAVVMIAATGVSVPLATAGPAVAHAGCGVTAPDKDSSSWRATASGANMRSGSSTGCAIKDVAGSGERLDYHCYTYANDGYTWTYVRNDTASPDTYGWIRDDLLSDYGSGVYCGF